jgi:PilZ domain
MSWTQDADNRPMNQHKPDNSNRRSSERIVLPADTPVYLETIFNGLKVKVLVEDISTGGVLLMAPDICLSLNSGRSLQGVLIFPEGRAKVDAIVRWQLWPRVGVQFEGISSEASASISKLLESLRVKA